MKQFDVCVNRGRDRKTVPYLVIVQSNEFAAKASLLVVPLFANAAAYPAIAPSFTVAGRRVVADPLLMFAITREHLGDVVGSLAELHNAVAIIGAIDRAIGQGYP